MVERQVLRRKFEMDNEGGLVGNLKNKIKARNEKVWGKVYGGASTWKCAKS